MVTEKLSRSAGIARQRPRSLSWGVVEGAGLRAERHGAVGRAAGHVVGHRVGAGSGGVGYRGLGAAARAAGTLLVGADVAAGVSWVLLAGAGVSGAPSSVSTRRPACRRYLRPAEDEGAPVGASVEFVCAAGLCGCTRRP